MKITEIIYDQTAEEIDYDNETKVLINDAAAEETTDLLPLLEKVDDSLETDFTEENPELGEDESDQSTPDTDLSDTDGDAVSTEDGDGDDADTNIDGKNPSDNQDPDDEGPGIVEMRAGKDNKPYYSSSGLYDTPPTGVDYVAAVGEAATIVSVLAGDSGALLFTSEEWVGRSNVKKVLGAKYNDSVQAAWSGDGTSSNQLSDANLEAMIANKDLECVFVMSGDDSLSESQMERLEDEGILVSVIPAMTTASNIKEALTWVGKVFALGDNDNESAQALAETYVEFHDGIVSETSSTAGVSSSDENGKPQYRADGKYTVYISDWKYFNAYVGDIELDISNGVGVARTGYTWSPLAYYMSVGGAANTASVSVAGTIDADMLVWQFEANHVPAKSSNFTPSDSSISYPTTGGNSYDRVLLTSPVGDEQGLGTKRFPAVIVKTQAMAVSMEADKKSSGNSLYKIYDKQTSSEVSNGMILPFVGPLGADGKVRYSTAGLTKWQSYSQDSSGVDSIIEVDADYSIYVNPEGLFESWTDGTIESVLESAWISDKFQDGYSDTELRDKVREFYKKFYGYDLSDGELETILSGPAS